MEIKTICKLTLEKEEGYKKYTGYKVYPVASVFTESDDDAIKAFIASKNDMYFTPKECKILLATTIDNEVIKFYRMSCRCNFAPDETLTVDYMVISNKFINR